jgi:hypothetical protein
MTSLLASPPDTEPRTTVSGCLWRLWSCGAATRRAGSFGFLRQPLTACAALLRSHRPGQPLHYSRGSAAESEPRLLRSGWFSSRFVHRDNRSITVAALFERFATSETEPRTTVSGCLWRLWSCGAATRRSGSFGLLRQPLTACAALFLLAPAAWGQFALYRVDGDAERPPGAVLDLGSTYPGESASARFRVRNTSDSPALLTQLSVRGTGFSIVGFPVPAGIPGHLALDFNVVFRADTVASYSAELDVEGTAVLLTASVLPRLTYQIAGQSLGASGIDFGSVEAGSSTGRRIVATNLTAAPLPLPLPSVTGAAFSLPAPPVPMLISPGESTEFEIVFHPAGAGAWAGSLQIDDRAYPLRGLSIGLPLPHPTLAINLADPQSARDGSIAVSFDEPARTAGSGSITLDFTPLAKGAGDVAIQLGIVGRWLPFTVAPGDTALPTVNFQTGTTAGTIGFTVELGGATDRKTVVIPAAPVAILTAQATRSAGTIDVRITGFDNTRTAGPVTFTFFDSTGAAIDIRADYTADFAAYFPLSDAGGAFLLHSIFPVAGDASKITEFAVQMTNAAGSATTGKIKF